MIYMQYREEDNAPVIIKGIKGLDDMIEILEHEATVMEYFIKMNPDIKMSSDFWYSWNVYKGKNN